MTKLKELVDLETAIKTKLSVDVNKLNAVMKQIAF